MNKKRLLTVLGQAGTKFNLQDEYLQELAAGAINGTFSNSKDLRTVVDTESKISMGSGDLISVGGKASPAWADPMLNYPSITREAGIVLGFKITYSIGSAYTIGFATALTGIPAGALWYTGYSMVVSAINNVVTFTKDTEYIFVIILRAAGAFFLVKGGIYTDWTLVDYQANGTVIPLYPRIDIYNSVFRLRYLRTLKTKILPQPILSDSFNRANGVIGITDGLGHPEANGGSGIAWTSSVGTWNISFDEAICGTLDTGVGIATLEAGVADVLLEVNVKLVGGNVGLIVRYVDASNYIRIYSDGTNLVFDEVVGGLVAATTSVVQAWTDNRKLRVSVYGNKILVFYVDAIKITETTIAAAVLQSGTKVGMYSTNVGNKFNNFNVYRRSGGNYSILDGYFQNSGVKHLFVVGDSKSISSQGWIALLNNKLNQSTTYLFKVHGTNYGQIGYKMADMKTYIDTNLASVTEESDIITLNLGANDTSSMPVEATYKSNLTSILDSLIAKWPSVKIYVASVWRRDYLTECNTLAGWNSDVIATYSNNVYIGMDERIWLEGGDDGAINSSDGVHYSAAGQIVAADAWKAVINP